MVETDKKNRNIEQDSPLDQFLDNSSELTDNTFSGDRFRANISTTGVQISLSENRENSITVVNGKVANVDMAITSSATQAVTTSLGGYTFNVEDTEFNLKPTNYKGATEIETESGGPSSEVGLAYNSRTNSFELAL